MLIYILIIFSTDLRAYGYADDTFAREDGRTWEFVEASYYARGAPQKTIDKDYPVIIWWTEMLYPHIAPLNLKFCPNSKCYVTNRRELLNSTNLKVLYFYGTEFRPHSLPLPRSKSDLWAVAHEESPMNNFVLDHAVAMSLFNYTATYHRQSDFPLSLLSFPGPEFILNRAPVPTKLKTEYQKSHGFAPVVYVQSHCEVPSDRDRYVKDLMKYIKVDSYGKCLHNKDLDEDLTIPVEKMFDEKFKELLSKYKFILSFENGICNDYMTEKLFRAFHLGSVPVIRGSPLVKDFLPDDHSAILVDDFTSPEELAEFLHKLNENDDLYEEYLSYKKRKNFTNPFLLEMIRTRPWPYTNSDKNYGPFFEGFECFLCDKATERLENKRKHQDNQSVPLMPPKITDGRKFVCPEPEPAKTPEKLDWQFFYFFLL